MRPVPTHDQLLELMTALLANAGTLVDDASLLFENDRFPRAYALAALAGEELGKVYLCLDALLASEDVDGKQFWWTWRQHGDKLDSMRAYAAAFVDDLESLNVDQLGPDARRIGTQKLSAIYVDFDGHDVLKPDRVAEVDAADLLQTTRLSVDHAQEALAGLSVDVVAAAHALAPELSEFFDRFFQDKEPEQVLAELRGLLVEVPGMTAEEIVGLLMSR